MNILKTIRSAEWWEYKLPPLLAIGYATIFQADKSIYEVGPWLLFLLLSIISGAVFVSLVNDFTDMEDDRASGKHNRLIKLSPGFRWALLLVSLLPGAVCGYFLSGSSLTLAFFIASYLAFTLYSVPPFRFKKRGSLGVLADACGAHLFPSLVLLAGTAWYLDVTIDWRWFAAVGVWALMYGLRGILWHQFLDRDNDLLIGLNTYATGKEPDAFKLQSATILVIELIALAVMLVIIGSYWPVIALLGYLLLVFGYYKRTGMKLISVVPPNDRPWHILMGTYYQALLPVSILFASALTHPMVWIVLAIHLLLFPKTIWQIVLDSIAMARLLTLKRSAL